MTELWLRLTLKTPALRAVIVTVWIEKSRKFQAEFHCVFCNHQDNADHNASVNILEAGRAFLAVEANSQGLSVLKGRGYSCRQAKAHQALACGSVT